MKNSDFKVSISDDFIFQLSEVSFYISYKLGNPNAAKKYYDKVFDKAYSLSTFPDRGPVFKTEKSTKDIIRKLIVGKYLITYYVDHKNKIVEVNNFLINK